MEEEGRELFSYRNVQSFSSPPYFYQRFQFYQWSSVRKLKIERKEKGGKKSFAGKFWSRPFFLKAL